MKKEEPLFVIPESFLDKLYEFTGSADKYKGLILIHCDEKGMPIIFKNCESQIIETGLVSSMKSYLDRYDNIQIK
jgi:hypothetical protein